MALSAGAYSLSNLSELLPSGGAQNVVEFVASGTLSNGQAVILNSNGSVTAVAGVAGGLGTKTTFSVGKADATVASVFDTNLNKFLFFYKDAGNSGQGMAVVASVNGSTISVGTPVVFESGGAQIIRAVFDTNANKAVITYKEYSSPGHYKAIVATASGTTISFGSPVTITTNSIYDQVSLTFDSNVNKVLTTWRDNQSTYGHAKVGTVSNTSISFGGDRIFAGKPNLSFSTFDTTLNKVILAYQDLETAYGNYSYGTIVSGTIAAGTTFISWGQSYVYSSYNTAEMEIAYEPSSNRTVIAFKNSNTSNQSTAKIASLNSSGLFTFGSAIVFDTRVVYNYSLIADTNSNKMIVIFRGVGGAFITYATVSGLTMTVGDKTLFADSYTYYIEVKFDNNLNVPVVAYYDNLLNGRASAVSFTPSSTNLTDTNLIGISAEAVASGATGEINVLGGLNEGQSSLTPASIYYVQGNGTITTASASPAQKIGQAISSTKLNLVDL